MDCDLDELREYIGQLRLRLDQLRDDVISKLNECSDCIKSAETLLHESTEITTSLETKLVNTSKDANIKLISTSIKDKIILDVGGEKYTTSIATLTREKDTFFTTLFSKSWKFERDPQDNSIFIDRNGKNFGYILEYLRTDLIPTEVMQDETLRRNLLIEAEYFRLHSLIFILTEPERKHQKEKEDEEKQLEAHKYFPKGTLLQLEHKIKLNEFFGNNDQQWELIYKASHDGYTAKEFHSCCNNEGPTITIIRSHNGYLFGGYTSISWTSDNSYKSDATAFLFTLTNPHNIPPTKYVINPTHIMYAVYHDSKGGPAFGSGHTLYVASESQYNGASYTSFPSAYIDTTGKNLNTFTGAYKFGICDVEVYKLA
jgi:hypothetical protein